MFWKKKKKEVEILKSSEYIELDERITKLKSYVFRIESDVMMIENRIKKLGGKLKLNPQEREENLKEKDLYSNMLLPE